MSLRHSALRRAHLFTLLPLLPNRLCLFFAGAALFVSLQTSVNNHRGCRRSERTACDSEPLPQAYLIILQAIYLHSFRFGFTQHFFPAPSRLCLRLSRLLYSLRCSPHRRRLLPLPVLPLHLPLFTGALRVLDGGVFPPLLVFFCSTTTRAFRGIASNISCVVNPLFVDSHITTLLSSSFFPVVLYNDSATRAAATLASAASRYHTGTSTLVQSGGAAFKVKATFCTCSGLHRVASGLHFTAPAFISSFSFSFFSS